MAHRSNIIITGHRCCLHRLQQRNDNFHDHHSAHPGNFNYYNFSCTTPVMTTSTTTTSTPTKTTSTSTSTTTTTSAPTTTASTPVVALNGAGGTFPAPLYTHGFPFYASLTGVQVNYQAVGSGAGITAITNNTVDFGASDAIMTSAQVNAAQASNGTLLTIPTTMGAVAIAYNLNTMGSNQLKLNGTVLANIYLKTITYWDDRQLLLLTRYQFPSCRYCGGAPF